MPKKQIISLCIAIVAVVSLIGGVTYALWSSNIHQTNDNLITTGCFEIEYKETSGSEIALQSAYPIIDAKGMNTTPYEFTIENTCDIAANYAINFEVSADSTLSTEYLKVALNQNTPQILSVHPTATATLEGRNAYNLSAGKLNGNKFETYEFRMWLDENTPQSEAKNTKLLGKIVVVSTATVADKEYCDLHPNIATCKITSLLATNPEMLNTDDLDGNIRFMGTNPNNYVIFNDESWRIIGVFNVASNKENYDAEITEKRVKIISSASVGNYVWASASSGINDDRGVNEWTVSSPYHELNEGDYYNRTSGSCASATYGETVTCDFSSIGLTNDAKALIGDAYWHTGTIDGIINTSENSNAKTFYEAERSTNIGKICTESEYCNDTVTRTTGVTAKLGLIYPSDYAYSTSGGTTTDRATCLNTELYNWDLITDCPDNAWINYDEVNRSNQWTMTPAPNSTYASEVFRINATGYVYTQNAVRIDRWFPTTYLSADVKITGGDGSNENPYTLAI